MKAEYEYKISFGNDDYGFARYFVYRRKSGEKWKFQEDFSTKGSAERWIDRDISGHVDVFSKRAVLNDGGAKSGGPIVIDYRWLAVAIVVASIVYKFVIKGL